MVDVGDSDGVEVGSVLGIYQSGRIVKDETATDIKFKKENEKIEIDPDESIGGMIDHFRNVKRDFDKSDIDLSQQHHR